MTVATPLRFDDSYARAVPQLSVPWTAAPVPHPTLLALNEEVASALGADPAALREPAGLALLTGHALEGVTTVAQAYAGHQFGSYQPRLGDGRALLLGEVLDVHGQRRDLHLKGSGPTPFSRGGDGFAAIGPMLREYVIGEAMHGLGIPTTRALAVVATGAVVQREVPQPGAVLCRVAASHLRVGTVQYAAATGDRELLRALADHIIARHHPDATAAPNPYLDLYRRVVDIQAELIGRWMLVGFVHGVMNTDNTTLSGETIDYGPCAFLDGYDPATVFSSIDHGGRYAYRNQPAAAQWNLARLGEALLPLIDVDPETAVTAATAVIDGFAARYRRCYTDGMAMKLGLPAPDDELAADVLALLRDERIDHTGFFRALAAGSARDLVLDRDRFDALAARRDAQLPADRDAVAEGMNRVNPLYIPRNHRVEEVLAAATAGNLTPFHRLVGAVSRPYAERPGLEDLTGPAPGSPAYVTYCGT